MSTGPAGGGYHTSEDEQILHKMGYSQELFRAMGGFQNFAISFTIISILAGCLTSYFIAFNNGGPIAISWGWLWVGLMSTIIALAMAEIVLSIEVNRTLNRLINTAMIITTEYVRSVHSFVFG